MIFPKAVIFYALVLQPIHLASAKVDYCKKDLCPAGVKHIACKAPAKFGPSCDGKKPKLIRMRRSMRKALLHEHNRFRSQAANGKLPGYSPAARMPTLAWDGQLQYVAGCNARLCQFKHDQCRSTPHFPYAGQNLAIKSLQGKWRRVQINPMLRDFVRAWFEEYKHTNQTVIDNFPPDYRGPAIGHFTQMVTDRTWKVGCAMVRYTDKATIHYYLVCNYSFISMVGQPVYVRGKSCSQCKSKCSGKYPGLCKLGEKVSSKP